MGLCSHDTDRLSAEDRYVMSQLASHPTAPVAPVRATPRAVRLAWMALVVVVPLAWGYVAVLRQPSDGTVVYASSSSGTGDRWSEETGVVVFGAVGDSRLARIIDEATNRGRQVRVYAVDGEPLSSGRDGPHREIGDSLTYSVTVDGHEIEPVHVTLARYPLVSLAAANPGAIAFWLGLVVAGCFVYWRRPRDTAARAFLALGLVVPVGMTAYPAGLQVIDFASDDGPWTYVVGDIANCFAWATMLLLSLEFPRPVPAFARRRWLRVLPFVLPFVLYAARYSLLESRSDDPLTRLEGLILPSATSAVVVTPLVALVLFVRLRQPGQTRENKLAIRVVLTSVLVTGLLFVVLGQLPQLVDGMPRVALWLQPIALFISLVGVAAAMLRYRIYELDVIVRRSLLLEVALIVVGIAFLAVAWLLNRLGIATDRTQVVVGGLVAVSLIPLGHWVRQRLNRWFFGARDDSYQVVSQLRGVGSSVSIEDALTDALTRLTRTLRLVYAGIEVDGRDGNEDIVVSVGEPDRPPTMVELEHHGQPWGRLSLGVSRGREPFGPRDRRLLDDVASQLGALVASLVMNRDLRRSRERIISAREEERRRIRRDLHDGLGPALAGQSMQLQFARELLRTDAKQVDAVLERMNGEVRDAIAEIRRLVDDLRPKVLDQLGLVSALRQHAAGASFSRAGEGDVAGLMSWSVSAGDVEPLPAAVEVAAYRIVLEGVNNAAKHSAASHCQVDLQRVDGTLRVTIADNGRGLPQEVRTGVGLGSMRERAEELGGTFDLVSTRRGTTVTIHLPLTLP